MIEAYKLLEAQPINSPYHQQLTLILAHARKSPFQTEEKYLFGRK